MNPKSTPILSDALEETKVLQGFFSLCLKAWKICLLVEGHL